MYGCFDPYVVYGFCEKERNEEISPEWLYEFAKELGVIDDLRAFAKDVVRNHGGDTVYGVYAKLNPKTGRITVSKQDKKAVEALYERVCRKNKERYSELGYYSGIRGDVENCHGFYDPDEPTEDETKKRRKLDH